MELAVEAATAESYFARAAGKSPEVNSVFAACRSSFDDVIDDDIAADFFYSNKRSLIQLYMYFLRLSNPSDRIAPRRCPCPLRPYRSRVVGTARACCTAV